MNRFVLFAIIAIVAGVILTVPLLSDQLANARTIKKIQFTQTVTSTQDPGQGHDNEQMAIILPPSSGSIYHGSLTYSASEPVQVIILHKINKDESKGQPTWTVDGNTLYAQTSIDSGSNGGTLDFSGSALSPPSIGSNPIYAPTNFDGWIKETNPQTIQKTPPT